MIGSTEDNRNLFHDLSHKSLMMFLHQELQVTLLDILQIVLYTSKTEGELNTTGFIYRYQWYHLVTYHLVDLSSPKDPEGLGYQPLVMDHINWKSPLV